MNNYDSKINDVFNQYLPNVDLSSKRSILDNALLIYEKVDRINIQHNKRNKNISVDFENAYFTICRIIEKTDDSNPYSKLSRDEIETIKHQLYDELKKEIRDSQLDDILIIEPHHDDALGSASSFLFGRHSNVYLYTLSKSGDSRDNVDLSDLGNFRRKLSTNRKTNVKVHKKCDLNDYHYENRYEKNNHDDAKYDEIVDYYLRNCPSDIKDLVERKIETIIPEVNGNDKEFRYIIVPLGLQHPMHLLAAYYATIRAKQTGQTEKVIYYVDHPYDLLVSKHRIHDAIDYYMRLQTDPGKKPIKYVRMDSVDINQRETGIILKELYNDEEHDHFGEFAGTLEKTCCSYYAPDYKKDELMKDYALHINNVLYVTYQAKPFFKTGGQGEVAYTYTNSLQRYVNNVAIITPKQKYLMSKLQTVVVKINGEYHSISYDEKGKKKVGNIIKETFDPDVYIEFTGFNDAADIENPKIDFCISIDKSNYNCYVEKYLWRGITYYLVDIDNDEGLFENKNPLDNENILKELTAFSSAVVNSIGSILDFQTTIIHCNDYQTALIPFLLKYSEEYKTIGKDIRTVYTIHYYGYRGIYNKDDLLNYLHVSKSECTECMICNQDTNDKCVFRTMSPYSRSDIIKLGIKDDKISLMKIGINYADAVNTVSSGYAHQISSYPDFEGISQVYGIRNGIVIPDHDYSLGNGVRYKKPSEWQVSGSVVEKGTVQYEKRHYKKAFQEKYGLPVNENVPLICMVTRLNAVKGLDDIKNIFDLLMTIDDDELDTGLQLIIIGDDDKNVIMKSDDQNESAAPHYYAPYGMLFKEKMEQYKTRFRYFEFSEDLEYQAYYASDILLMPSRDEACGTTQMLAMKHGVIPVVTMIPSFYDTVVDYAQTTIDNNDCYVSKSSIEKGVGFYSFRDDCWILLDVIKAVVKKYKHDKDKWRRVINSTYTVDFSWDNGSIIQYLNIYNHLS